MNAGVPQRRVAIGFGSSLGPRRQHIERAVRALDRTPGLRLLRASRLVRTPPMRGGRATGWFLNAVAVYRTTRTPHAILDRCRALEDAAGRRRGGFWADRTLDLDVLLDERFLVDDPDLIVPHPDLLVRRFVIEPLLEVWPDAPVPDISSSNHADAHARGPAPVRVGVLARSS